MKNNNINQTAFSISYDGKETLYDRHEISALELSEIIFSMNNLVSEANALLNKGKKKENEFPILTVSSPIKEGSIIIDFVVNLIQSGSPTNIAAAIGFTGASIGSLLGLISKIGNNKPQKIEATETEDKVVITDLKGKKHETTADIAKLLDSYRIRQSINDVFFEPLQKPNAKLKIIDSKGSNLITIQQSDSVSYKLNEIEAEPESTEINTTIKFAKINLYAENGWSVYFQAGEKRQRAVTIEDNDFLKKVQNASVSFDTDILFEVILKIIDEKDISGRSRPKYIIKKVVKQISKTA